MVALRLLISRLIIQSHVMRMGWLCACCCCAGLQWIATSVAAQQIDQSVVDRFSSSRPQQTAESQIGNSHRRFRIRVTWGGGATKIWYGTVSLSKGEFHRITPLGMASDAGATLINKKTQIAIRSIKASEFSGFDAEVISTDDDDISIEFQNPEKPQSVIRQTFPMTRLHNHLTEATGIQSMLDASGNRIEIIRSPGDHIRPVINRPHLVFAPGERFELSIEPLPSRLAAGSNLKIDAEIRHVRSRNSLWKQQFDLKSDANKVWLEGPMSIALPNKEGAYDIELALVDNNLVSRLNWNRANLSRTIQVVVVNPQPADTETPELWREVTSLDPSGKNDWRERLSTIPNFRLGTWSPPSLQNDGVTRREIEGRTYSLLRPGGWQALALEMNDLNQPHLIEIEYLDEGPMSLGISLIQSDQNGQIQTFGADTGIHVPDSSETGSEQPRKLRHRFFVWPTNRSCYLLFANRHTTRSATIGQIRILAGPKKLASIQTNQQTEHRRRAYFAFYEKPLFAANFSAEKTMDPQTSQPIDDWHSFLTGANRWTEYLNANGYTGAMLVVAGDGSSLYPSPMLQPTPRFDTGVFSSQGNDPIRKDVVEMLLRVFEREGLQLIPVFHFNFPLVELERARMNQTTETGIELVDFEGLSRLQAYRSGLESVAIYNLLDPEVRLATTNVIEEFLDRYQQRTGLRGLGILYSRDSATVLPGQTWGMDKLTITRFAEQRDLSTELASQGQKFMYELFTRGDRDLWLSWRTDQMANWLENVQQLTSRISDDARLFILGTDLFETQDAYSAITPSLRRNSDLREAADRIALPVDAINENPDIVFLRPYTIAPEDSLAASRANIHLLNSKPMGTQLVGPKSDAGGFLFSHKYSWAHFSQFQQQKPFGREQRQSVMRLQPLVSSSFWNRERFANALLQSDCHYFVDGGWLTSFGQEEQSAELIEVFTKLPVVKFDDILANKDQSAQSLVVRQAGFNGRNYVYVLNPTPWNITAKVVLASPSADVQALSTRPMNITSDEQVTVVSIELRPFDIFAAHTDPQSTVSDCRVEFPNGVAVSLQSKLNRLMSKVSRAENVEPIDVLVNPGFERSNSGGATASNTSNQFGWQFHQQNQPHIKLVDDKPYAGGSAIKLTSDGREIWLRSNQFAPPPTGRLSISVWLRTDNPAIQPPLRLSIDGHDGRQVYYRYGNVGNSGGKNEDGQIGNQWRQFAVHFDDLPPTGLGSLQIGFDLMGEGTVFIDKVEVYDRWLDEQDSNALMQLLQVAKLQLTDHRDFDHCRRILEGYWPRFLNEFFPDDVPAPVDGNSNEVVEDAGEELPPRASLFEQIRKDIFPKRR